MQPSAERAYSTDVSRASGTQNWLKAPYRYQRRAWSSSLVSPSVAHLSETQTLLRNLDNGAEIFLVGTAHVSRDSADEVRELIHVVRPSTIMVELCKKRADKLRSSPKLPEGEFVKGFVQDLLKQLGKGNSSLPQQIIQLGMQGFYRLLKSWGMDPGLEFKVAMEEAERLPAKLIYGDADQDHTMRRISENFSMQDVWRMLMGGQKIPADVMDLMKGSKSSSSGLAGQVEAMKSRKAAKAMTEYLRTVNPGLAAAMTDERDELMFKRLQQISGRGVGVVGLAHLDGIEQRWRDWQSRDRSRNLAGS
ncbi:g10750 [Coccomyxa viridis]|uniref:G10750 protein n=1 Tax=Coccomyxa viridis TaxID=1274662 RepID=A0ABP1G669_9CHLO